MKSRKQRRISGILLLFMGLIFFAGCGSGGNSAGGSERDGSSVENSVGSSDGNTSEISSESPTEPLTATYKMRAKVQMGACLSGKYYAAEDWRAVLQAVGEGTEKIEKSGGEAEAAAAIGAVKERLSDLPDIPAENVSRESVGFEVCPWPVSFSEIPGGEPVVVSSHDALTDFAEEYDVGEVGGRPVGEYYGAPFFAEKALVFFSFRSVDCGLRYKVGNLSLVGNELICGVLGETAILKEGESAAGDTFAQFVLEVDKAVLSGAEKAEIVFGYEERNLFLLDFDLDDPKIYWDGDTDTAFRTDEIIVTLKRTEAYPQLTAEDFPLENMEGLTYLWLRPSGDNPEFRQMLKIRLKEPGKEAVVAAVAELEGFPVVKFALPVYIYDSADD